MSSSKSNKTLPKFVAYPIRRVQLRFTQNLRRSKPKPEPEPEPEPEPKPIPNIPYEADRISTLPNDVLLSILSQLSFNEAVELTNLSKGLHTAFRSIPRLFFNSDGWLDHVALVSDVLDESVVEYDMVQNFMVRQEKCLGDPDRPRSAEVTFTLDPFDEEEYGSIYNFLDLKLTTLVRIFYDVPNFECLSLHFIDNIGVNKEVLGKFVKETGRLIGDVKFRRLKKFIMVMDVPDVSAHIFLSQFLNRSSRLEELVLIKRTESYLPSGELLQYSSKRQDRTTCLWPRESRLTRVTYVEV